MLQEYINEEEVGSMREKILEAIYIIFILVVVAIAVATMFPANGPPPDQISQVRQQIKSEQMIQ